jgi:hypothetical protein
MSFEAAVWSTKYVNDLPDSSFSLIESGGKKDSEGKTVPRSLRHLPYKDKNGKVDIPHLRNAMARVTHTKVSATLQKKAHDVLLRVYKQVGMEHPSCSVSGCKGYSPKKKSMLEVDTFRAYQEEWFRAQGKRAVLVT